MRSWIRRPLGAVLVAAAVAVAATGGIVAVNNGPVPAPTATATATATPGGCAAPTCFPKPGNTGLGATGIPPGTVLASCGSDATLSTPNQTISGCAYTGSLLVTASNVTIKNSRVKGSIRTQNGNASASFTVQDSELGPDTNGSCGGFEAIVGVENYTARRNYLHWNGDGFRVSGNNITVQDNFTLLCSLSGDHSDGLQGFGGGLNVTVDHNTLDQRPAAPDVTAPIFFADNSSSCICTNNLLLSVSPTSYALRIHDDHTPDIGPWVITGNRLIGVSLTTALNCATTTWTDNRQVTVDSNYNITSTGALVNC